MKKIFKQADRQGFIFPILVFVLATTVITTSLIIGATNVLIESSTRQNYGAGAYYAAQQGLNRLINADTNTLADYATSCAAGEYINYDSGDCALPGITGTTDSLGSNCSYSVRFNSTSGTGAGSTMNVDGLGFCSQDGSRNTNSGSMIKINADLTVCIPDCDGSHCSDDGCGGTCTCPTGYSCSPTTSLCELN